MTVVFQSAVEKQQYINDKNSKKLFSTNFANKKMFSFTRTKYITILNIFIYGFLRNCWKDQDLFTRIDYFIYITVYKQLLHILQLACGEVSWQSRWHYSVQTERKNARLTFTLTQIISPRHINFCEIITEFWTCKKNSVNSTNALLLLQEVFAWSTPNSFIWRSLYNRSAKY